LEANLSDIHELIAQFRRAGAYIELGGGDRVRFKPGNRPRPACSTNSKPAKPK